MGAPGSVGSSGGFGSFGPFVVHITLNEARGPEAAQQVLLSMLGCKLGNGRALQPGA